MHLANSVQTILQFFVSRFVVETLLLKALTF